MSSAGLPRRRSIVYHAARAMPLALLAACAGSGAPLPQPAGAPPDTGLVVSAINATRPAQPMHVVFSWVLQEGENRFTGKGVARVEPPYRARLDLFGPRGEAYLSAILEERELRLPPGVEDPPLPPAAMLWSALGVFQAPDRAVLVRTEQSGEDVELHFESGTGKWTFRFDGRRLVRVEQDAEQGGRHTVVLEGVTPSPAAAGELALPAKSTYRDWAAFRELVLTIDEVRHVAPFPAAIWSLGGS